LKTDWYIHNFTYEARE